jgi:hypothetical protein
MPRSAGQQLPELVPAQREKVFKKRCAALQMQRTIKTKIKLLKACTVILVEEILGKT